jgi:predicted nucleotidyltransferase
MEGDGNDLPGERLMTITLDLDPDGERQLAERAARAGQGVTDYVRRLIARDLSTDVVPPPLSSKAILERLAAEGPGLREKFGVKTLAVFGSMARGDDREGSDVDLLVTFEGAATFDNFMGLKLHLEDTLGRSVDLGTPDTLRPEMRAEVERDAIRVA